MRPGCLVCLPGNPLQASHEAGPERDIRRTTPKADAWPPPIPAVMRMAASTMAPSPAMVAVKMPAPRFGRESEPRILPVDAGRALRPPFQEDFVEVLSALRQIPDLFEVCIDDSPLRSGIPPRPSRSVPPYAIPRVRLPSFTLRDPYRARGRIGWRPVGWVRVARYCPHHALSKRIGRGPGTKDRQGNRARCRFMPAAKSKHARPAP